MRAATGAIRAVRRIGSNLEFDVIGECAPRGFCGSGLVDAVAAGLESGFIDHTGRLSNGSDAWQIAGSVALSQKDIRELQLAKSAIAAGLLLLLKASGPNAVASVDSLYLAGAFGNYVNRESACRIGLVPIPAERIVAAGNTALLGAKLALFPGRQQRFDAALQQTEHVSLNECPEFQETFIEQMHFPALTEPVSQQS
jgi:uncharacterized 2Fe-2S/4Fe-4S cluster protein (DUF4445 family)